MIFKVKPTSIALFVAMAVLSACATPDVLVQEPVLPVARVTQNALFELPPPRDKLDVAVYKFEDVTGQFKPAEGYQDLSRAVSQGGSSILVKALQDAGNREWFTVIERANLSNLLQERKIISEMRQRYLGETKPDIRFLPPMRFAGILIEGGVIGYDSNTLTGGAGARLLGIGATAQYRQDTISVDLRAVSVKTGEIMASTVVHKTLISTGISGASFSFIDVDKILELEAGISTNEPGLIALTKAIEKAVHTLILEGADLGLWAFEDESAARTLISEHRVATGRSPLPELAEREIAQKVVTKVEVDTKPKVKAKAKAKLAKPSAVSAPKQSESGKPKPPNKVANKPVVVVSANAAQPISDAQSAKASPRLKVNVKAQKYAEAEVGVAKTRRVLPAAQQSRREPVPVKNDQENSTAATVPIVTKVSP